MPRPVDFERYPESFWDMLDRRVMGEYVEIECESVKEALGLRAAIYSFLAALRRGKPEDLMGKIAVMRLGKWVLTKEEKEAMETYTVKILNAGNQTMVRVVGEKVMITSREEDRFAKLLATGVSKKDIPSLDESLEKLKERLK